jgi:hypothetical protein
MARYRQAVAQDGSMTRVVERPPWSPAQIVAVLAGILLVVVGGVALARSGVNFSNVPATHSTVGGLHYTSMSALIQLVAGVFLLAGGAYPDTAKASMAFWGAVLLAFGLVVAIDPVPFFNLWGYTRSNGVFYAVIGGVILLAAAISPIIFTRQRVVTSQQPVEPSASPPAGVRY